MIKQEVDPILLQDLHNIIKQAQNEYNSFKKNKNIVGLQQISSIITNQKFNKVFDFFLKNTGIYSKLQFLLNKATQCEEMLEWDMSFFNLEDVKHCNFSLGKNKINFVIPSLSEQISLMCSEESEYFGILFAYYLNKQKNMVLETAICVNMLLTILENQKREAA
jgi:hypothetical protein